MSGEPKKVQPKKKKNDSKEQRNARSSRGSAHDPPEQKQELSKVPETSGAAEPGPEFYKNLKKETDEIIKITEESNAKYSKKVIQSNWKKYEAPMESYEEREEVENMGADFEQLVNAPVSSGGHFKFKHEKSWDTVTDDTRYAKYFNIDIATLAINMLMIPFYERCDIDLKLFPQSDVSIMTQRARRFKERWQHVEETGDPLVDPNANVPLSFQEYLNLNKKCSCDHKKNTRQKGVNDKGDSNEVREQNNHEKGDDREGTLKKLSVDNKADNNECNQDNAQLDKDEQEILQNVLHVRSQPSVQNLSSVSTEGPENIPLASAEVMETKKNYKEAEKGNPPVLNKEENLEEWLDDFLSS